MKAIAVGSLLEWIENNTPGRVTYYTDATYTQKTDKLTDFCIYYEYSIRNNKYITYHPVYSTFCESKLCSSDVNFPEEVVIVDSSNSDNKNYFALFQKEFSKSLKEYLNRNNIFVSYDRDSEIVGVYIKGIDLDEQ